MSENNNKALYTDASYEPTLEEWNQLVLQAGAAYKSELTSRTVFESELFGMNTYILMSMMEDYLRVPERIRTILSHATPTELVQRALPIGNKRSFINLAAMPLHYLTGRELYVDRTGSAALPWQGELTVRSTRRLDADPERVGVGPLDYEVLEPLKSVRFRLRENHVLPIRFDLVVTGVLPPFLERKDEQREPHGFRIQSDLLRYHQASTVSGTIWIDGQRIDVRDDEWFGFRDHSWGVRMDVGEPAPDVYKPQRLEQNFLLTWSPMWMRRPDGTSYEIHHYQQQVDHETTYFSGFVNEADGSQHDLHAVRDELKYDPVNRRLLGGKMIFDAGWGETRTVEIEAASDTGFHLGTAKYFGFRGDRHGQWHGENFIDGERFADASNRETVEEIHQLRDCVIRVREGDAVGYGIFESMVIGEHPRYGLTRETSFL